MKHAGLLLLLLGLSLPVQAAEPLKFGVANQRPVMLTAQIWNPILTYVSNKSGVPLVLSMGKTATETTELATQGKLDFIYTNQLFTPERDKIGFQAIARFNTSKIQGQIVVAENSDLRQLSDLAGKKIASPSKDSFISYALQMKALSGAKIKVEPVITGSQEGGIVQLAAGVVDAAFVHSKIIQAYAQREGFHYRAIYTSEPFLDLPVMVHPRVPRSSLQKVRDALINMSKDEEGRAILAAANNVLMAKEPLEFVSAKDRDYDNYRRFYSHEKHRSQP